MPEGISGNKSFYVDQEEATLMKEIIKEGKKAGDKKISEGAIMKAGLRLYLNLPMKEVLRAYRKLDE